MGVDTPISIKQLSKNYGCGYMNWLAKLWKKRAANAKEEYLRWREMQWTLKDYAFGAGNNAWLRAVREVQKVFPGTEGWLITCSGAEGGHGRWVGYGGVGYSTWLRDSNTVGGPMQFRFGTFTGMFRHGVEHVRQHGYKIPEHLLGRGLAAKTRAWQSALGQAIAAGWARFTGNDDSHWSASWGNGC